MCPFLSSSHACSTAQRARDLRSRSLARLFYGKLLAQVLSGSAPNEGFRRAWIEFDNQGNWGGSPNEFEPPLPEESIVGPANVTNTFGFGASFDVNIGVAPRTVGGGLSADFGGSMSKSKENWHPVVRGEIASGGVQWCYYDIFQEFGGSKSIAARVGIRQAINAQLGGWNILKGMQDSSGSCPPQE